MSVAAHLTRITSLWPPFGMAASPPPPPPPAGLTFKSCFYSFVSTDATIAPLISQLEILRVSEGSRYAAVSFRVTTRTQPVILDGPAAHDEVECEVKIRGCDSDAGSSEASILVDRIALAVRALFNGFANWTMAGLPVMTSIVTDDADDYGTADDGSDEGTYIQTVNIFIRHRIP